ncbi:MAG: hypothetical protein RBT80_03145 [Candidatus Vecturithrix sp.]|jgi:hypothetical protein|nr:hypothetical protein [Candidatus Vecturithrix sp.]
MKKDIYSMIAMELDNNELLLWAGQPKQGIFFRKSDIVFTVVSYLWGGGWIYWEYHVMTQPYSLWYKLWGIPFMFVGFYLMFGRFWVDAFKRKYTYYGLTDKRILIISDSARIIENRIIPGILTRCYRWLVRGKGFFSWTSLTGRVTSFSLTTLPNIFCLLDKPSSTTGTIIFGPLSLSWLENIYQFGKPPPPPRFEMIEDVKNAYELICKIQRQSSHHAI